MRSLPTRVLLSLLLVAVGVLVPGTSGLARTPSGVEPEPDSLPNVVLIMADDMAAGDLQWMPRTRRLLGGHGLTFDQGVASNPMCCPARAALLTGQESHNSGVWANTGGRGGHQALTPAPRLPDWLQAVGYRTAFFGKHLNGFTSERAAAEGGWNVLDALVRRVYFYRSFTTWDNGSLNRVRNGYITDYLTESAVQTIRRFDRHDDDPFFAWISHLGPHKAPDPQCPGGCWGPPVPAEQDLGDFAGLRSPSRDLPSWNHRTDETEPPFLRDRERVSGRAIDITHQRRLEALQSVDRSVAATVRALRDSGELARTLLIFTSDNGYLLGQHRYVGKLLPYEESIRVPLLVRGAGIADGTRTDQVATATDLTRTIVELTGAVPSHPLDGISLVPVLAGYPGGRNATILQTGAAIETEGDAKLVGPDDHGWLYRGYRDDRWTYARYPDPAGPDTPAFEELYDRDADPYQLRNLATDPAYAEVLERARARATELAECVGNACHPAWGTLAGPGEG